MLVEQQDALKGTFVTAMLAQRSQRCHGDLHTTTYKQRCCIEW